MIPHWAIFPSIGVVSQFLGWRLRLRFVGSKHTDLNLERNDLGLIWSVKGQILGLPGSYQSTCLFVLCVYYNFLLANMLQVKIIFQKYLSNDVVKSSAFL